MKLLFLSDYISPAIIQAICRTLLHSLWQGLLAATAAGIIILLTQKTKAAIRYNLLSLILVSLVACSFITFLKQPGVLHTSAPESIIHSSFLQQFQQTTGTVNAYWLSSGSEKFYTPLIYYADKYAGWITGLWMLFFVLHLLRTCAGLHYIHRIRNYQVTDPGNEWKQRLLRMKHHLGIGKAVAFMESGLVKVPVAVGFLKPMVLIPIGMISLLPAEQVETILMHELAHIRRKDFIINLLQRFTEAFFFYNPFIAWISARIREEREACCDDIVMEHTTDNRSYLEALVSFRELGAPAYGHAMALGRNNNLLHRVKRMITQENKKLNAMEKLTLILVLMAFGALSFIPAGKRAGMKKDNTGRQVISKPETTKQISVAVQGNNNWGYQTHQTNDTLPDKEPLKFENISSNIDDDGTIKKEEVTAKTKEGKVYHYRLLNNEMVEMMVDDEKIKKEDFHRYDDIVDQIEAGRKESAGKSLLDQKKNTAELLKKQELLNKQLMDLQNQQSQLKQAELEKQNNENMLNLQLENQQLMNQKLALQDKKMQELMEQKEKDQLLHYNKMQKIMEQNDKERGRKQKLFELQQKLEYMKDEKLHESDYELSRIIDELEEAGVINDENSFSFSLDDKELIVDGKKQSEDLHDSLRKKYVKHKKDYFKYKTKGNSRSTDIYVE